MVEPAEVDLRDHPTRDFIQNIREKYPVEPEFDRVLTRKMELRRETGSQGHISLDAMVGHLVELLDSELSAAYEITDAAWYTGGASKMQLGFTLESQDPMIQGSKRLMVRMEPAESLNATSRLREFEILRAMEDFVPVPRPYWVDESGSFFPNPALIYEFMSGVTKPSTTQTGEVTGIGTDFGPAVRENLAPTFAAHLARIHTSPVDYDKIPSYAVPRVGTKDASIWQLNRPRRVWAEDRLHEIPYMVVAAHWLHENMPVLDEVSVLHGDYRAGNFLYDEETYEITAWLDWERSYLGDRHRDLAWTMTESYGGWDESSETFLVSGIAPRQDFLETYQAVSGLDVDPERLHYFRVLNYFQMIVAGMGTAHRLMRLGKTHQDVLLPWIQAVVSAVGSELEAALQEKMS